MRRSIMIFVCTFFMFPGLHTAWCEDRNEIGLYLDPDDLTSYTTQMASPGPIFLYLVLTNPFDEETGTEIGSVVGFECKVTPAEDDIVFGFTGTNQYINILQPPEMIVGFATPVPVIDGQATLGYLTVLTYAQEGSYYFLGPITSGPPSIPEMMAFAWLDEATTDDKLAPMYPVSGSLEDPVFAVNGEVVSTESETWGGVKALYR